MARAIRERIFLDWSAPPLPLVAARLLSLDAVRLARTAVCLPSARAGRLLLSMLVEGLAAGRQCLTPPVILTPGELTDHLDPVPGRRIEPLTRRLAWLRAIECLPGSVLDSLRAPANPAHAPLSPTPDLADALAACHDLVTIDLRTFASLLDAPRAVPPWAQQRLEALAQAEVAYIESCRDLGLVDAAHHREANEPSPSAHLPWDSVTLVGVADLPAPARRALLAADLPVTSLVFAPPSAAAAFDDLGCVLPDHWSEASIDLSRATITFAKTADDLVDAALAAVASLPASTPAGDVVLGLLDDALTPRITRRAAPFGFTVRPALGDPASRGPFASLLRAARDLSRERTFRAWGTLLRHPWVEREVARRTSSTRPCLGPLDDLVVEHLPDRLGNPPEHAKGWAALRPVLDATRALMGPLESDKQRPLSTHARDIATFLDALLPHMPHDDASRSVLGRIESALDELLALAHTPRLDRPLPAHEALTLVLESLDDARLTPEHDAGATSVEAVGWLELPLDPAPHAIVLGMHDGLVPARDPHASLLPPGLLAAVGIERETRRAARDAYLLSLLAHSRASLTLLVSRLNVAGEPAMPSRLLFRCDDQPLLDRIRRWTSPLAIAPPTPTARTPRPASGAFTPLPIRGLPFPESWRVTSFKQYLRSPYAFYIQHMLDIQERQTPGPDLGADRFGSLIHDAISRVLTPEFTSRDEGETFHALKASLLDHLQARFGTDPPTPLWLQGQQALARLEGLARWQVQRVESGWRTIATEWKPKAEVRFTWPGGTVRLTGRIDRVDLHPTQGLALIDYKTAEKAADPMAAHRSSQGTWLDLQLPLYRHLASELIAAHSAPALELAYVNLSADGGAQWEVANWTDEDLRSADDEARRIIAQVAAGNVAIEGPQPPTEGVLGALVGRAFLGAMEHDEDVLDEEDDA